MFIFYCPRSNGNKSACNAIVCVQYTILFIIHTPYMAIRIKSHALICWGVGDLIKLLYISQVNYPMS